MSSIVQVLGRLRSRAPPPTDAAGVQKAPRQEIAVGGAPALPQALWGFSHGAWLDEVGRRGALRSVCRIAKVSASGWTRGLRVVRGDWQCGWHRIEQGDASVGVAGGAPAGMASVVAVVDRR